jgi:hypothetical protein
MATTIDNFMTKALDKQFLRDFMFRITNITIAGTTLTGPDDLIYARSATLPGRAIENKIVNYSGQQFNVPGKSTYTNSESYSIEFYHDEKIDLRTKLEGASRKVFNNEDPMGGDFRLPGKGDIITLNILDRQFKETKKIELVGASIRDIGAVTHNIADGTGDVLTFPVTFSYHYYKDYSKS